MAIVKSMVDSMGGTVDVKSRIGEGTSITITLTHRYGSEEDFHSELHEEVDNSSFAGKRILLTEDNELNAEIAMELLKEQGFIIEWAKDGVECIDILSNAPDNYYDLILMDVQMPNLNGYDATRRIREMDNKSKAKIPILAMTANAFAEDKAQAIEAGMDGHIAKPLDIDVMYETMRSVL